VKREPISSGRSSTASSPTLPYLKLAARAAENKPVNYPKRKPNRLNQPSMNFRGKLAVSFRESLFGLFGIYPKKKPFLKYLLEQPPGCLVWILLKKVTQIF